MLTHVHFLISLKTYGRAEDVWNIGFSYGGYRVFSKKSIQGIESNETCYTYKPEVPPSSQKLKDLLLQYCPN